jgi:hypothetical protein
MLSFPGNLGANYLHATLFLLNLKKYEISASNISPKPLRSQFQDSRTILLNNPRCQPKSTHWGGVGGLMILLLRNKWYIFFKKAA